MYLFDQDTASIEISHIPEKPVVSLLRNFSAPVNLKFDYSDADLAFLIQHETNGFNQWQATQTLLERILLDNHQVDIYIEAYSPYSARYGTEKSVTCFTTARCAE